MRKRRAPGLLVLMLLVGCNAYEHTGDYCVTNEDCTKMPGTTCSPETKTCVVPDAGAQGAVDAAVKKDAPADRGDDSIGDPDVRVFADGAADGPPADAPLADAPPADAPPPDVRPVDAPGSCTVDNDCKGSPTPHCVLGICVACASSKDCAVPEKPICVAGVCMGCKMTGDDCSKKDKGTPACDEGSGRCVQCLGDKDCTGDPNKSFCGKNTCVGCDKVVADACKMRNGKLPGCGLAGACVECTDSSHCGEATKPICNTVNNTCVRCTADDQCASKLGPDPGVCMSHQDGRCAKDTEAIYVSKASCVDTGGGTPKVPWCRPQSAINAVSTTQRVIVLRGPEALSGWSGAIAGTQVSIIGQGGAVLGPSADPLIHVTGGDVFVRGVTLTHSQDVAVVADGGGTIRLDRCIIKDNDKGGLVVTNGGFDVSNTVFDGNGPGLVGTSSFGGVYLGTVPVGAPAVFRYNTVVFNKAPGVLCEKATQPLSGLLLYMNQTFDLVGCPAPSSSKQGEDPKFDARPYHLTAGSPCVGAGEATNFPPDDLDGEVRPKGGKSDCGADEL